MRTRQILSAASACTALLVAASAWPQAREVSQIPIPELKPFQLQQPRLVELPNGLTLMLQTDRELPFVRGYALIRGGSRDEPADKAGLASIYAQAWRTGGLKGQSGDDLDVLLENKAALVETDSGLDATSIAWDCLKDDFPTVLDIVKAMLVEEPAFPIEKIVLAKTQLNSEIARRDDDADEILKRESRKLVYGATSPYARTAEYATVAAVTRDDLVAWHRRCVQPNNIVMAVSGDFDLDEMESLLRGKLADWPRGTPAPEAAIPVPTPRPGYYLIQKDDLTQSKIQMAHLGLRRDTPDFYAIEVMNEAFGGGFGSRLMTEVRAKQGLAYHVWGGIDTAYDHPGLFTIGMGTKSDATVSGIEALLAEIDALVERPLSEAELSRAKDSLLNTFIFRIDSSDKILRQKVNDYFHGYPLDRLERYVAGVRAVSAADVQRVAREHIHKDQLATLVVGKPSAFDRPLASLGPVTMIDIAAPAPGGSQPEPLPAASDDTGKALLRKTVAAFGDPQKLKTLTSARYKGTIAARTPQGEMSMTFERTVVFPDRMRQRMTAPMGEITMVVAPQAAFMVVGAQTRDMPASQRGETLTEIRWSPLSVARSLDDPGLVVTLAGKERIGEREVAVLALGLDGQQARWWVDPGSGQLLRMTRKGVSPMGPVDETHDYSDYRAVGGLKLPFVEKVSQNGELAATMTISSYEINPKVDAAVFENPKPAQP